MILNTDTVEHRGYIDIPLTFRLFTWSQVQYKYHKVHNKLL